MNMDERVATLENEVVNIKEDVKIIKNEAKEDRRQIQSLVVSVEKLVTESINKDREERKKRDEEVEARFKAYEENSFWNKLKGLLSKSVGGALVTALSGGALFVIYKIYNLIFG